MRKRERKYYVTFSTTTDAMAMEAACREQQMPGRLIPVPPVISAGCGLAWCADPADREGLKALMCFSKITAEDICECMI